MKQNNNAVNHIVLRARARSGAAIAALFCVLSLVSGCSRGYSRFLKLPADPSTGTGLGWALVTSAYAQARTLPNRLAPNATLIRKGTVFECLERRIDPEGQDTGGLWYRYGSASSGGWIHSGDLSIFSSEEQARDAIAALGTE